MSNGGVLLQDSATSKCWMMTDDSFNAMLLPVDVICSRAHPGLSVSIGRQNENNLDANSIIFFDKDGHSNLCTRVDY